VNWKRPLNDIYAVLVGYTLTLLFSTHRLPSVCCVIVSESKRRAERVSSQGGVEPLVCVVETADWLCQRLRQRDVAS